MWRPALLLALVACLHTASAQGAAHQQRASCQAYSKFLPSIWYWGKKLSTSALSAPAPIDPATSYSMKHAAVPLGSVSPLVIAVSEQESFHPGPALCIFLQGGPFRLRQGRHHRGANPAHVGQAQSDAQLPVAQDQHPERHGLRRRQRNVPNGSGGAVARRPHPLLFRPVAPLLAAAMEELVASPAPWASFLCSTRHHDGPHVNTSEC